MQWRRTFLFLILESGSLAAQATPAAPPPPPTLPHGPIPDLHEVTPGILEFHGVRLDKKNRRISFTGEVNQRDGLIEYVVVNEKGKTHESLISTKIAPRDIHLALLLIGLDPKSLPQSLDDIPPDAIDSAYLHAAPKMKGDPTALANNPRAGYDNDQIWQVREEKVPPLKTPVEVSITLADSPNPATP
jgi:hypothetical protein